MKIRRWSDGDEGTADGVRYRVVKGKKHADDLRLDILVDSGWRAVHMSLGALLADFFYENENAIYPDQRRHRGGWLYIDMLKTAATDGWQYAVDLLKQERASGRRVITQASAGYDAERTRLEFKAQVVQCVKCGGPVLPSSRWANIHPACHPDAYAVDPSVRVYGPPWNEVT